MRSVLFVCKAKELLVSGPKVVTEPDVFITVFAFTPSVNLAISPADPLFTSNLNAGELVPIPTLAEVVTVSPDSPMVIVSACFH
jgi:hypothetical protein